MSQTKKILGVVALATVMLGAAAYGFVVWLTGDADERLRELFRELRDRPPSQTAALFASEVLAAPGGAPLPERARVLQQVVGDYVRIEPFGGSIQIRSQSDFKNRQARKWFSYSGTIVFSRQPVPVTLELLNDRITVFEVRDPAVARQLE